MSRGLGRVERALLAVVREIKTELRPERWIEVTRLELGLGEHRESRRRAAHSLSRKGLIELCTARDSVTAAHADRALRRGSWQTRRRLLYARLPLSADEASHAQELRKEYLHHRNTWWDDSLPMEERVQAQKWVQWYEEHPSAGPSWGRVVQLHRIDVVVIEDGEAQFF